MKRFTNHLFILCLVMLAWTGCRQAPDTSFDEALRHERDSLLILANTNQAELERMTSFFNAVGACIDSINEQETLLSAQIDLETNRRYSQREIAQRLEQLTEIIIGQREKIASLVDSLNNRVDSLRLSGLRNTIAYLTTQLEAKEAQINSLRAEITGHQRNIRTLKAKVDGLTAEVGDLTTQNTALSEAVQVQTEIINEGYILVATKNQLKSMGVIEGGGFLKKSKVNLSKVNLDRCDKVNIALFDQLPIPSDDVKILTPAPAASYRLREYGDHTTLVIKDPNAFWSLSNILVIQK